MKVVYSNGTEGVLSKEDSKKLYIQNRFTKAEWEELEEEMRRLDIIKFEDPFISTLRASGIVVAKESEMTSIEYVKNQVAAH